jgi:hypothetical protein
MMRPPPPCRVHVKNQKDGIDKVELHNNFAHRTFAAAPRNLAAAAD